MLKKSLVIFLVLFTGALTVCAHKFYTSLTQIEYNRQSKSAEVIMNLYADDVEAALSQMAHRKVRSNDKDFAELSYRYLDSHFQLLDSKNHPLKNQHVGFEFNRDMISFYIEIKLPGGLNKASLKQTSLLELYNEQLNIVNLHQDKSKNSLAYKAGAPAIQTIQL